MMIAGCKSASESTAPTVNASKPSATYTGDTLVIKAPATANGAAAFKEAGDLAAAEEFYTAGDWQRAQKLFTKVADDKSTPPLQAERARYYEGECFRMQQLYPDAKATYNRLVQDFPRGEFREKAVGQVWRNRQLLARRYSSPA